MYSTRSWQDVIYRDELGWDDDVVQVSYRLTRAHPSGIDRPHTGRIGRSCSPRLPGRRSEPEGGYLAPIRYRITVRGRLTKPLASAFEGLDIEPGVGQTALVGEIRDQSHLYGVLDLVRALGLDLLSVERTGHMTGQILNPLPRLAPGGMSPLHTIRRIWAARTHNQTRTLPVTAAGPSSPGRLSAD